MRYEIPAGLDPAEEAALRAALDQLFPSAAGTPDPWSLAARAESLRLGALQVRHRPSSGWKEVARREFARRGFERRAGRADSR